MKPIFIGGCERSGTTLLGAMLGGHADLLCVPEMQFKFDILRFSGNETQGAVQKADILRRLVKRSSFRIWELDIDAVSIPGEENLPIDPGSEKERRKLYHKPGCGKVS